MKIVSFKICPFVQRVIAVAEFKELPYEVVYISLQNKPEWFLKKSPHGKVPLLETDEGALFESNAICEYLEEAYPDIRLYPENLFQKAIHRAWVELAPKNYMVQCAVQRSANLEELESKKGNLDVVFEKIEPQIKAPFFSGPSLSMVDAAWFVLLHRTELIKKYSGFDFLQKFPTLMAWRNALMNVEALQRSVPDDFEAIFCDFYLNEHTYLGQLMREKTGCCGIHEKCECTAETLASCCS